MQILILILTLAMQQSIDVPQGAELLGVETVNGQVVLAVKADPNQPLETRSLVVVIAPNAIPPQQPRRHLVSVGLAPLPAQRNATSLVAVFESVPNSLNPK